MVHNQICVGSFKKGEHVLFAFFFCYAKYILQAIQLIIFSASCTINMICSYCVLKFQKHWKEVREKTEDEFIYFIPSLSFLRNRHWMSALSDGIGEYLVTVSIGCGSVTERSCSCSAMQPSVTLRLSDFILAAYTVLKGKNISTETGEDTDQNQGLHIISCIGF